MSTSPMQGSQSAAFGPLSPLDVLWVALMWSFDLNLRPFQSTDGAGSFPQRLIWWVQLDLSKVWLQLATVTWISKDFLRDFHPSQAWQTNSQENWDFLRPWILLAGDVPPGFPPSGFPPSGFPPAGFPPGMPSIPSVPHMPPGAPGDRRSGVMPLRSWDSP